MSSVDEILQAKLREIVDVPAPSADKAEQDVLQRMARRRRRRRVVLGGAVVCAVLAVGGALVVAQRLDDGEATVAGTAGAGGTTTHADSTNALASVRVQWTGLGGAEKVVFTFAEALPTEPARSLPGIGSVTPDPAGIVYTTQGADEIHICETRHFGFKPYPSRGSVDVFIPATWTGPGFDPSRLALDMVAPSDPREQNVPVGKVVGCGPYRGYVQYSILGPPSNILENVSVVTESNQLVVEIRP